VDEGRDDLRECLLNEIGDRAQVLEGIPPPREYGEHAQAVVAALDQANLSIHLLGAAFGRRIKDRRDTSYPREQAEIALARPVHQILWLPDDLVTKDIQDSAYRGWIETLKSGQRQKAGLELVRSGTSDLIALIRDRIEKLRTGSGPQEEHSLSIAPMDGGNGCFSAFSVLIGGASHVARTLLSGDFLFWCLKRSGDQSAAVPVPACFPCW